MNEIDNSTPMDHTAVIERLPWLVNGTLDIDEEQRVREHLEACESCRTELQATREGFDVFDAHLPTEVLLSHAWGEDTGWPRETVERHLASCPRCAEELEMVEEGRERLNAPSPFDPPRDLPFPPPRALTGNTWRYAALAATVLLVLGLGGWWNTWHSGREEVARLAQERDDLRSQLEQLAEEYDATQDQLDQPTELATSTEELRHDLEQAQQDLQALEARREDASAPPAVALMPPLVVELYALTERGAESDLPEKTFPEGVSAAFLLAAPPDWKRDDGPFRVRLLGGELEPTEALWQDGYLGVQFPEEVIPVGEVTLEVETRSGETQTYRFVRSLD